MVSVINDMLINDGKAPVGFINPVLYENANNIGVDIPLETTSKDVQAVLVLFLDGMQSSVLVHHFLIN